MGGLDRFATNCVTFYSEAEFLFQPQTKYQLSEETVMAQKTGATPR
jgi:hypothetical protein